MRLIGSLLVISIFLFFISKMPDLVNFLITIHIIPDTPAFRESTFYQWQALFVVGIMVVILVFIGFVIMLIYGGFLDYKLRRKNKQAKKRALQEYGTELPYIAYLKSNEILVPVDVMAYKHDVIRAYYRKMGYDYDEMFITSMNENDIYSLYEKSRQALGFPVIENHVI